MPWTVSDVDSHIKNLTAAQKKKWVAIANNVLAQCIKDGGSDKVCAPRAIRIANAGAKKQLDKGVRMRIENIDAELLKVCKKHNLGELWGRCVSVWDQHFEGDEQGKFAGMTRSDFLQKYDALINEMNHRKQRRSVIGTNIDKALLRKNVFKIDPSDIGKITLEKSYISLIGKYISDPKNADVELLFKANDSIKDRRLELVLNQVVQESLEKKVEVNFQYEPFGVLGPRIPLFDLALVPRVSMTKVVADDFTKVTDAAYYAEQEMWTRSRVVRAVVLLNYMGNQGCRTVLEMGCGSGRFADLMKSLGFVVQVTEDNPTAIKMTTEKGLTVLDYDFDGDELLPFEKDQFEFVISVGLLNKVKDPLCVVEQSVNLCSYGAIHIINIGGDDPKNKNIVNNPSDCVGWMPSKKIAYSNVMPVTLYPDVECLVLMVIPRYEPDDDVIRANKLATMKSLDFFGVNKEEVDEGDLKEVLKFEFKKVSKDEHIVSGVIYSPDILDGQGEYADTEEIRKAMYSFMEGGKQTLKFMHKGSGKNIKVLECFQTQDEINHDGGKIPTGTWYMSVRVNDRELWKKIKSGEITGFSMGGTAQRV